MIGRHFDTHSTEIYKARDSTVYNTQLLGLCYYSKHSRDFLLCTKKEMNLCIIYTLIYGGFHGLESVLVTCTVCVAKQHPVNISSIKSKCSAL